MKIVFLCGSLEPGRDGVGDYTTKLAGELIRNGHTVGIVALNDKHITEKFDGIQSLTNTSLPVLRLPSQWIPLQRFQKAGLWINDFDPEWLSLQFVPFAFNSKGLAFGLGKLLVNFGKHRKWHVMVHELWVGMNKEAPLKNVYWGRVQKQLIKSLLHKLKPAIIHTQTSLYLKLLQKMGFTSQLLPLFGNISMIAKNNPVILDQHPNTISLVVFGGIHPNVPIGQLANELKLYSNETGKQILLKMIGRCGSEQSRWEKEWKEAGLLIEIFGEQPEECISDVLTSSSFGISTTPPSLVEKSGSVAAMREHGLSVLCVSAPWNPRGVRNLELPSGVIQYEAGKIREFIENKNHSYPVSNISDISFQFMNNLLSA